MQILEEAYMSFTWVSINHYLLNNSSFISVLVKEERATAALSQKYLQYSNKPYLYWINDFKIFLHNPNGNLFWLATTFLRSSESKVYKTSLEVLKAVTALRICLLNFLALQNYMSLWKLMYVPHKIVNHFKSQFCKKKSHIQLGKATRQPKAPKGCSVPATFIHQLKGFEH